MLNIRNNEITSIRSTAFGDLSKLDSLDASYNKLTRLLDNRLIYLTKIQKINLSHNQISSIQSFTFSDLTELRVLDLSFNQLHSDNFIKFENGMKFLNLTNNQYQHFNLTSLKSIESVNLTANPWNCTWLVDSFVRREHHITKIQFGQKLIDNSHQNTTEQKAEYVNCIDPNDMASVKNILIIDSSYGPQKNNETDKKVKYAHFARTLSDLFYLFVFCFTEEDST